VSELVDRDSSSPVLDAVVPSAGPHSSARDADIERDYASHRGSVLGMLRGDFPRLRDIEELYNEAWAELRRGKLLDLRAIEHGSQSEQRLGPLTANCARGLPLRHGRLARRDRHQIRNAVSPLRTA
jgi:hypothetical protein